MTQTLQPGQHPDADQLNAFVEHSLPPHEQQQTFAHLATCADCRAIVYLSQEAVPDASTQPQPIATSKPLFGWNLLRGWNLAWPAVAALACLVFVTLHLRNATTGDRKAVVNQTAHLEQTPPPTSATSPPAQPAPLKTVPSESPKPLVFAPDRLDAAKATSALRFHGSLGGLGAGSMPARGAAGGYADEFKTESASRQSSLGMASTTNVASSNPTPATAPVVAGSLAGPLPGGITVNRSPQSAALASDALAEQAAANTAATPLRPAPSTPVLHSLNQQYNAPPPAPPLQQAQAASPGNVTETVNVSSASAPIETESSASAGLISSASFGSLQSSKAMLAKKQQASLPSHLPALSTVSNARQQLALDTVGALFHSQDAGVTWQPVPAQWTGRAVKIALAPSPNQRVLAKDSGSAAAPSTAAKPAAAAPVQPAIFELTNDAGELWTSTDGQIWKHKQ